MTRLCVIEKCGERSIRKERGNEGLGSQVALEQTAKTLARSGPPMRFGGTSRRQLESPLPL